VIKTISEKSNEVSFIPRNSIGEITYESNNSNNNDVRLFIPIRTGLNTFVTILPKLLYGSNRLNEKDDPNT
jgi:hypothetical protein